MRTLLAAALLLTLSPSPTVAQSSLRHLKSWADELPVEHRGKRRRNIFKLPEVRGPLVKMLGPDGFKELVGRFKTQPPAELIDGHLVLEGWHNHMTNWRALVAIDLRLGVFYVCLISDGQARWMSSDGKPIILPDCIIEKQKVRPALTPSLMHHPRHAPDAVYPPPELQVNPVRADAPRARVGHLRVRL